MGAALAAKARLPQPRRRHIPEFTYVDSLQRRGRRLLLDLRLTPKCRASPDVALRERVSMHIRGASLIESLVAMSVFSIGSAATSAWFIQTAFDDARASRLAAASAIAASLEARMRSNVAAVDGGDYTVSSITAGCVRFCSVQALAADDLRGFRKALAANVGPAAHGAVRCKSRSSCIIRITWNGREVLAWAIEL